MSHITKKDAAKFAALAAKLAAKKAQELSVVEPEAQEGDYIPRYSYGKMPYNIKQDLGVHFAVSGKSFILTGAAGSGKTYTENGICRGIIDSNLYAPMRPFGHPHLPEHEAPGILIVGYTNKAVNNSKNNLDPDLRANCITIHKALAYKPDFYEAVDETTGDVKRKVEFTPTYTADRPLPASIHTVIIEEASMLDVPLFYNLMVAMPHKPRLIFVGDIQQLPPVFGSSIFGFMMLKLPVIELDHIYRQALKSPIIRLAHRILSGEPIPKNELTNFSEQGKHGTVRFIGWQKKINYDDAIMQIHKYFHRMYGAGAYVPEEDIILMPYNKAFGTLEVNRHIAQMVTDAKEREVYEVIAGFNKHYFAIGEKVLFEKEEGWITDIQPNPAYLGQAYQPANRSLNYWGIASEVSEADDLDFDLDAVLAAQDVEDKVNQASHIITVHSLSKGVVEVSSAAEINDLLLGYAITVHKSQGSEWRRVFFLTHQSNNTMIQREFLYTAVTRAKEELYIICEPDHFEKGIKSQKVKGETVLEKAQHFQGKLGDIKQEHLMELGISSNQLHHNVELVNPQEKDYFVE